MRQSIYYDYGTDIALETLARWLGTEIKSGNSGSARRLFLTDNGSGETLLYYMDDEGRAFAVKHGPSGPPLPQSLSLIFLTELSSAMRRMTLGTRSRMWIPIR
jgi:hypothetical protein